MCSIVCSLLSSCMEAVYILTTSSWTINSELKVLIIINSSVAGINKQQLVKQANTCGTYLIHRSCTIVIHNPVPTQANTCGTHLIHRSCTIVVHNPVPTQANTCGTYLIHRSCTIVVHNPVRRFTYDYHCYKCPLFVV